MFGKVWFLKRYHSNNQCTVPKSKVTGNSISDLIKVQCKDTFLYKFKILLHIRTLIQKVDNKSKSNPLMVKVNVTEARNWHKISDFHPYLSQFLHDLV